MNVYEGILSICLDCLGKDWNIHLAPLTVSFRYSTQSNRWDHSQLARYPQWLHFKLFWCLYSRYIRYHRFQFFTRILVLKLSIFTQVVVLFFFLHFVYYTLFFISFQNALLNLSSSTRTYAIIRLFHTCTALCPFFVRTERILRHQLLTLDNVNIESHESFMETSGWSSAI